MKNDATLVQYNLSTNLIVIKDTGALIAQQFFGDKKYNFTFQRFDGAIHSRDQLIA